MKAKLDAYMKMSTQRRNASGARKYVQARPLYSYEFAAEIRDK